MADPKLRLRALTLWPEWAWAAHYLDKRVENRSWALPVGEWFALHAGKHIGGRPGPRACEEAWDAIHYMASQAGWARSFDGSGRLRRHGVEAIYGTAKVQTSAILGIFRVTRIDPRGRGDLGAWRVPDQVGNVFEYTPIAAPVPCRGAQGLWPVPLDVAERVLSGIDWPAR